MTSQEADRFGSLVCEMFTGDPLYLEVNGKVAERASSDELDNTFVLDGLLQPGMNQFTAIYENQGRHGYRPMEELSWKNSRTRKETDGYSTGGGLGCEGDHW